MAVRYFFPGIFRIAFRQSLHRIEKVQETNGIAFARGYQEGVTYDQELIRGRRFCIVMYFHGCSSARAA
jgi:hypothetical protein